MITPRQRNALPVFSTLDWDYFNVKRSVHHDELMWFQHREWDYNTQPKHRKFRYCEEDTWVAFMTLVA